MAALSISGTWNSCSWRSFASSFLPDPTPFEANIDQSRRPTAGVLVVRAGTERSKNASSRGTTKVHEGESSSRQTADGKVVGKTLRALSSVNRAPKKWLGQHYMVNEEVTQRTVRAARIQAGDLVLEVGPGTGALTQALVDAGACVIAIEKDKDMANLSATRFAECPAVQIVNADFLDWPIAPAMRAALDKLSPPVPTGEEQGIQEEGAANSARGGHRDAVRAKVVANLPFNITTEVLQRLLPLGDLFSHVVLMLQDEAALRLVEMSPRGFEYRKMTVMVHFFSEPKYDFFVDRKSFLPPPRVDAAVASFALRRPHEYPPVSSPRAFFALVHDAFLGKRKMLRNSLQRLFSSAMVAEALTACGLSAKGRPEELSLQEFIDLFNMLERLQSEAATTALPSIERDSSISVM
eukprot:TRINITY_DN13752_c0_g1_i1.p1 TRINITY_DN13752_c0_g1~~TRINITY_DN13752_c0_g1_i1.p1  ORF type:complete len:409 (-),score=61.40 TRINITY_DN13752_c0_g1_i1:252-1478(-)